MEIIQIISQHKKIKRHQPLKTGMKRIEAVIREHGIVSTRHIDVPI